MNAAAGDHAANVRKAERMLAQMPTAIAARERIAEGKEPIAPRDDLDHPANFLHMVNGKVPTETERQAFDVSLVLYTEHELNASTLLGPRVTVSTLSDIYSGVGSRQDRHAQGAAPRRGRTRRRGRSPSRPSVRAPERAEQWIKAALARKARIMGFGHRVYKTIDPRATFLKEYCAQLAAERGRRPLGARG